MSARELYEGALIELNKENAPNLILEDFNYFANKAINLYVNKRYNIYDISLQTTDDLRVLKATAKLTPTHITDMNGLTLAGNGTKLANYEVILPADYLHILNCICVYKVNKTYKCYNKNDTWRCAATRLTADAYSQVMDNFWNKPTYKKPYYYIHNVNTSEIVPTNPYNESTGRGTDYPIPYSQQVHKSIEVDSFPSENLSHYSIGTILVNQGSVKEIVLSPNKEYTLEYPDENILFINNGQIYETGSGGTYSSYTPVVSDNGEDAHGNKILKTDDAIIFDTDSNGFSNIERAGGVRYGNASLVRMEIRYGSDNSIFELTNVYIDYVKAPQIIRLTQEQLDYTEDRSQVLEWPDYVCQEIINELVNLIMENIQDLRIQTHPIVTLSIANPAQQLTPQS